MSNLTTANVIVNDYKTRPFFSKEVAEEKQKLYKEKSSKIYQINPENTDCFDLVANAACYLIVFDDKKRQQVADTEGAFYVTPDFLNALTLI